MVFYKFFGCKWAFILALNGLNCWKYEYLFFFNLEKAFMELKNGDLFRMVFVKFCEIIIERDTLKASLLCERKLARFGKYKKM